MIRQTLILIFTCVCLTGMAQVNIITTIVGTGTGGYNGDTLQATSTQLNWPDGLALDKHGNLLIVDPENVRVRKLSLSTGLVNTIAGYGTPGSLGDGGAATLAQLNGPQGICIDSEENIYIADGLNHKVRKISVSSGIITTIAGNGTSGWSGDGGAAISAKINAAVGVTVYKNYLYIAQYWDNRVRRVDLNTGIISTVAGNGIAGYSGDSGAATDAKLNGVFDVTCDNDGNIFVSDQWNGAVRKIDINTNIITTVAGNGTLGYSGDNGPATNAKMNEPGGVFFHNSCLYISDYRNGAIRKVDISTGIITTIAGSMFGYGGDGGPATNAKLSCVDVCLDEHGNIYIADYGNHRVRKVNNAVAVNGIDKLTESKLYPNPTKGIFTIQTPIGISIVNIYNIAGMRVYERTYTTTETEIDITFLPTGVYMVYVQCRDRQYVSKVVKE